MITFLRLCWVTYRSFLLIYLLFPMTPCTWLYHIVENEDFGCSFCIVEFIEVGKPARALDTLYEVFRNKKWTYCGGWSESVLEPIMFKYLDLCVELKKSHIAKEGLFQYRNMFQSVS